MSRSVLHKTARQDLDLWQTVDLRGLSATLQPLNLLTYLSSSLLPIRINIYLYAFGDGGGGERLGLLGRLD